MKRILFIAGILATVSFNNSFAQDAKGTDTKNTQRMAIMKTERMAKELELSDEQRNAVMQVNLHYAERMKGAEKVSREDMKLYEMESDARFKVILKGTQYEKYQVMKKQTLQQEEEQNMVPGDAR